MPDISRNVIPPSAVNVEEIAKIFDSKYGVYTEERDVILTKYDNFEKVVDYFKKATGCSKKSDNKFFILEKGLWEKEAQFICGDKESKKAILIIADYGQYDH